MLWTTIKTKYVLHFEDDWMCGKPFNLKNIMDEFIKKDFDMLTLRKIGWADDHIPLSICDNNTIYNYIYNARHRNKPEINVEYDESTYSSEGLEYQYQDDQHWWWPGFTLNPSIYNFDRIKNGIGLFNNSIEQELFEYDYALRCYYNNLKTRYIDLNINHTGYVSSYTLNDMKRYYD